MKISSALGLSTILARTTEAFSPTHRLKHHNFFTALKMSSSSAIKKKVLVPIAEDSEEIETSCITDVLTRFGAEVVVASIQPDGELVCKMSRGLKIKADVTIDDAATEEWDCIALPGGMPGAKYLRDCQALSGLLQDQHKKKKIFGAVCASPAVVLQPQGLLGSGSTCYPAVPFRSTMDSPSDEKVVVQDNVVTSQGPGTSLLFALSLGEKLVSFISGDHNNIVCLSERIKSNFLFLSFFIPFF